MNSNSCDAIHIHPCLSKKVGWLIRDGAGLGYPKRDIPIDPENRQNLFNQACSYSKSGVS